MLPAAEILAIYKREAVERSHDISLFNKAMVQARAYSEPGKVMEELDVRRLAGLRGQAVDNADGQAALQMVPVEDQDRCEISHKGGLTTPKLSPKVSA